MAIDHSVRQFIKRRLLAALAWTALITVLMPAGCVKQDAKVAIEIPKEVKTPDREKATPLPKTEKVPEPVELTIVEKIQNDPVAYFENCLAEARKIRTFRSNFLRQERLQRGLAKQLMPAEHMIADYRDNPFSVRFTWTDEDSEYLQCVYIEGQNDNKVALLPRRGLFGLKPTVGNWPVPFAVAFHKTRNPITDFGLRRMMERTLDRIEKAKPHGEVKIKVQDAGAFGPDKRPCYHFEILYPTGDEYPCKLQDLYIDSETKLPVETRLWLTEGNERTTDTLDAIYQYTDFRPGAEVTDRHFVIDINQKKTGPKKTEEVTAAGTDTAGATE
ncbi:MAG: DUF1571 domain-containing protein [Phycisphaerales bacterium]|nr:DUF1571 domain-containing protein [Phycisphaerales bacterium]